MLRSRSSNRYSIGKERHGEPFGRPEAPTRNVTWKSRRAIRIGGRHRCGSARGRPETLGRPYEIGRTRPVTPPDCFQSRPGSSKSFRFPGLRVCFASRRSTRLARGRYLLWRPSSGIGSRPIPRKRPAGAGPSLPDPGGTNRAPHVSRWSRTNLRSHPRPARRASPAFWCRAPGTICRVGLVVDSVPRVRRGTPLTPKRRAVRRIGFARGVPHGAHAVATTYARWTR